MDQEPKSEAQRFKENFEDIASDVLVDAIFDRHYFAVALVTLAPKNGQPWSEEGLQEWLDIAAKIMRRLYALPAANGSSHIEPTVAEETDGPTLKARYVDALLTELESGETEPNFNSLCDRIERALNRWDHLDAPWLHEHYERPALGPPAVEEPPSESKPDTDPTPALEPAPEHERPIGGFVEREDGGLAEPKLTDEERDQLEEQVYAVVAASPRVALRKQEIVERMPEVVPGLIGDAIKSLVDRKRIEKCGQSSATCYRTWSPVKGIDRVVAEAREQGTAKEPRVHPVTVRHVDPATLRKAE